MNTDIMTRFSDRDLVMRFRGGGVGHKSTRDATDFFKNDRDPLDLKVSVSDSESEEEEISNPVEEIEPDENLGDSDEECDYGYNLGEISDSDVDTPGNTCAIAYPCQEGQDSQ
jgi:hypothetical protein